MNEVFEPKAEYYRLILPVTQRIQGGVLDAYFNIQGVGLGGTIKHGAIYIESLQSTKTAAGAATPWALGASGNVLKISSRTIPLTDPTYQVNGVAGNIEYKNTFQIIKNNQGTATGTKFTYVNSGDNYHPECAFKFSNWNTSQPLNIQIECLDGTAITAVDLDDYVISLVIVAFPRPVGMPLNQNQKVGQ